MDWLYIFPVWLLCLGFVVAFGGLIAAGTVWARRVGWTLTPNDSNSAAMIHSFIGVVYAVALALTVVFVEEGYQTVEEAVNDEVVALWDVYRSVEGFGPPANEAIQADIRHYVDGVIDDEWPRERRNHRSPQTRKQLENIDRTLIMHRPRDGHQEVIYAELMGDMDRVRDARQRRVFLGQKGISNILWAVIVIGALITLGFCCFLPVSRLSVHLAMNVAMASLFALIVALIVSMDHPMRGEFSVSPAAFEHLRDAMSK